MKASDLFVHCLEAEGVERIYGVPGEENADVMISLLDSQIEFILCRHEQAAAFAADAYGRLTGKPGVCLGTLGPGATNLVTGVADANMDRAPLVCIIGQASTRRLHKESHQNMDSIAMFGPISKWAQTIWDAEAIPEVVRKAFKLAEAEKPGATVIELPEDISEREIDAYPMKVNKTRRPAADNKAIKKAVDLIISAKSPLVLAGNGAVRKRAAHQLRRFAHKSGIGIVNTFMGKGAVPRKDEHCLFTMGLQGNDYINLAMDEADLIITVGYDLVEYAPEFWNKGCSKTIIHVDFWPAEVDHFYQVDVDIVGDIADALWQINEELNKFAEKNRSLPIFNILNRKAVRQAIVDDFERDREDMSFPMKPQKIIWDVRQTLKSRDILLSDVGAHKMWISRYYQCDEANTCLISNGFCSMGFALPGAMGAKFAYPESNILAISGDAGFLMNVQDLETLARYKISVTLMVWCDGEYGLIKWKQQNSFGGLDSPLAFNNPDFTYIAKAFGIWGKTIASAGELRPALEESFRQSGPALIAVPVDYRENRKLTERLGNLNFSI